MLIALLALARNGGGCAHLVLPAANDPYLCTQVTLSY